MSEEIENEKNRRCGFCGATEKQGTCYFCIQWKNPDKQIIHFHCVECGAVSNAKHGSERNKRKLCVKCFILIPRKESGEKE